MEKNAIQSWVNNSKRFSLYVDNTEKSIFHGRDDDISKEWGDISRTSSESKMDVIRRIMQLRLSYLDITKRLQSADLYHATNFQQLLENFESKLSNFKQTMRAEFDSLELSEHVLSNELVSVVSNFELLSEEAAAPQRNATEQKKHVMEKQQNYINKKAVIEGLDRKVCVLLYVSIYYITCAQCVDNVSKCFCDVVVITDCSSWKVRWLGR
jgi:hypothetical protein